MSPDRHLPARLLSGRPGMSAPEKEAVLDAVLSQVDPGRRPRTVGWRRTLVAACAAAVVLIVLPLLAFDWLQRSPPGDGLTARGGGPAPFGLQIRCPGPGGCRPDGKLVFQLDPPAERPWFTAFGRRPDGLVVWYFPATSEGRSTDARLTDERGVLPTGVQLGADHPAGRVQVLAQFCERPVGRAQIQAVYEGNTDPERIGCTLVEQTFDVSR